MVHPQHDRPPRVKLARLSEFVSKSSGRPYWSGFLGNVKVVAITSTDEPTVPGSVGLLDLFIEAAPSRLPKPASASNARPARASGGNIRASTTTTPTTSTGDDDGGAGDVAHLGEG